MPKLSLRNRLLHLRISTVAAIVLSLIAVVQMLLNCNMYEYQAVPREQLTDAIYTATVPQLVPKESKAVCPYDHILQSKKVLQTWELPKSSKDIANFSAHDIKDGGYMPEHCNPLFSVAILVTYRNRQSQLDIFLPYMHNFLRKQNIHYKIYLIEQLDEKPWNKGLLYNIGAKIAIRDKFPCLILHDVDLLPLAASNLYVCMRQPRHLSASIDKFRFVLPYGYLVGGVLAIRAEHYTDINGFSNRFHNWGGEDDDLAYRLQSHNLEIYRFPRDMSEYSMMVHRHEPENARRAAVLRANRRGARAGAADGLGDTRLGAARLTAQRLCTWVGVKT